MQAAVKSASPVSPTASPATDHRHLKKGTKNGPAGLPGAPRPARVVCLLQDLEFGGTQRQIIELAARLDPDRFQAEIWLLIARDDMAPVARAKGLEPVWLSRHSYFWPLVDQVNLWRRLRARSCDLLMLLTGIPNIWGRILARGPQRPVIVGNCRNESDFWLQGERFLWPLCDHIICNASALKDTYVQRFAIPPDRLSVIPNGVDTDHFRPPDAPRAAEHPRVLAIGRLVPDKDHDTLIRAFALVLRSHPRARLWLLGNGRRREAIQRLAESLLPPGAVTFFPGQTDPRPLMHQADLLALGSLREGMPNVVLEAMATGLPVVATRVGGLADVVVPGKTGWLVPPRNPAALAAAISQVLADDQVSRDFGRAGRELAEQRFSLTAMVESFQEVFTRLLKAAG